MIGHDLKVFHTIVNHGMSNPIFEGSAFLIFGIPIQVIVLVLVSRYGGLLPCLKLRNSAVLICLLLA